MTKMDRVYVGLATIGLLVFFYDADASEYRKTQEQDQDQHQKQYQDQDVTINIGGEDGQPFVTTNAAPTTLSSEDNSSLEFNTSNESHNTVMVPNNNTEGCLRVFGLGFPTSEGSVVLGVPWRSGSCDLKDASKDAFAQGNRALGWMLKCKIKGIRKAFGSEANCLSQTVEAIDMQAEIERLRGNIEILQQERKIDSSKCEQSKDRIFATCNEDK